MPCTIPCTIFANSSQIAGTQTGPDAFLLLANPNYLTYSLLLLRAIRDSFDQNFKCFRPRRVQNQLRVMRLTQREGSLLRPDGSSPSPPAAA